VARLAVGRADVLGVGVGVRFGRFRSVVCGVVMMAVSDVRMMSGQMMITGFEVARGFAMMTGRVFVMFGCFVMVLNCFVGHRSSVTLKIYPAGRT